MERCGQYGPGCFRGQANAGRPHARIAVWSVPARCYPRARVAAGCEDGTGPTVGTVRVSLTTIGADIDSDGYSAGVDGGAEQSVGANGTVAFMGLPKGDHALTLSGAAENCTIGETNPQTVRIPFGRYGGPS